MNINFRAFSLSACFFSLTVCTPVEEIVPFVTVDDLNADSLREEEAKDKYTTLGDLESQKRGCGIDSVLASLINTYEARDHIFATQASALYITTSSQPRMP